jgi:hypothetical protein
MVTPLATQYTGFCPVRSQFNLYFPVICGRIGTGGEKMCNYLLPGSNAYGQGEINECLLPDYHQGPHLTKTSSVGYLLWYFDTCGGDGCETHIYHRLDLKLVPKIIAQGNAEKYLKCGPWVVTWSYCCGEDGADD